MLKNYFQIALRSLLKHKSFTLINIFGLAVGMAIAMMSILYVTNELTYDRFHENQDRLFRLILKMESSVEGTTSSSQMTAGIGPSLLEGIPEVESLVRFSSARSGFLTYNAINYDVQSLMYADSSVFDIFSFPMIQGDPSTALKEPFTIVITQSLAIKIFGDVNNAMGKIVNLNNGDDLLVTGIIEDIPLTSHLQFEGLVSFVSLYKNPNLYMDWNGGMSYYTYLLLYRDADLTHVESQIADIAEANINKDLRKIGVVWYFFLQPLRAVHLNTVVDWDIGTRTSPNTLLVLIAITFVILLIACVNFINLTTASSLGRMKEVGIRKVTGARKSQVVLQFLTESVIISFISLVLAFALIEIFSWWISTHSDFLSLSDSLQIRGNSLIRIAIIGLFLIFGVGLIAGIYPAFYISGIKPALTLKGRFIARKGNPVIRNLLVVFQFAISVVLIICTVVIASQLHYLLTKDKGFDPANKLIIPLESDLSRDSYLTLEESLLTIPGVEKVGASSQIPGQGYTRNGYFPEGLSEPIMIHALDVDYDYLASMGLEIVQGRNFSKDFGQDKDAYIINQALVRQLGWMDPVGKTIKRGGEHKVIGVVKDYNYSPLHNAIEPLIITLQPWQGYSYLTISLSGNLNEQIKQAIEARWKNVVPYEDCNLFQLDTFVKEAYQSEKVTLNILIFCSVLAIIIASLGLLALAAFMTRQRYKEIAVRKVFGALLSNIFFSVSTGFLKWVLIANIVAWPLAYLFMDRYLQNFAFSVGISWWVFATALLFSILLSLLVILYQVIRLGQLNPIDYIRYE